MIHRKEIRLRYQFWLIYSILYSNPNYLFRGSNEERHLQNRKILINLPTLNCKMIINIFYNKTKHQLVKLKVKQKPIIASDHKNHQSPHTHANRIDLAYCSACTTIHRRSINSKYRIKSVTWISSGRTSRTIDDCERVIKNFRQG